MSDLYSLEFRKKVLHEFDTKIGRPFSHKRIEKEGGVALFKKLTGKEITIGGIISFLTKSIDPVAYKAKHHSYAVRSRENVRSRGNGTNPLFNAAKGKYILVPSHGDSASYESIEEVKEAIERCQSANLSMIKFKLLEIKQINVRTTVSCEIS